jgi:peptidoglycan hydrolase CwlO-like protein
VTTVQQLEEKCHHLEADIEQLISNIKEKDNQIEELKQNLDINHELILKLESEKKRQFSSLICSLRITTSVSLSTRTFS